MNQPNIYLVYSLYSLLGLFCLIQLYFLLFYHRRLAAYKVEPRWVADGQQVPVSVIISARNESENLTANLPLILEQQYPQFEVVVVNDCSLDSSDAVLKQLAEQYAYLKIVNVTEHPRFKTGKKFALTMGIKASSYEHMLFTDADCIPASPYWLAGMAAHFDDPNIEIVLGYSPYIKERGFINSFTRFETVKTGMNYLSAALAKNAYMGIGRNLAYTKSLFFRNKGFAAHMHLMAGDDDLFVNQNATPANTVIELQPETFTQSRTKMTFSSYFKQKKRHMGVGKYYRNEHRRLLSFDALSGFMFYVMLLVCLVLKLNVWILLGIYLLRLLLQLLVYLNVFKKLQAKDLIWLLPFFDLVYYVYLNVFGLIGTFIKTTQWK